MLLDEVEKSNSADCQWLGQVLDFLIEDLEFERGDRLEDLLHVELRRDGVVDEMELGDNSWRNLRSTSTGLTHGGNDLEILDVVWLNLLSIIPELVVHPLSDELQRWLGPAVARSGTLSVAAPPPSARSRTRLLVRQSARTRQRGESCCVV